MDQNGNSNQQNDNNAPQMPMQDPNMQGQQQQQFVPYASFPATQQRDFDPNIYNMIAELVDRKYGAELNAEARKFEISRVYNKLEIEVFEMSTFQLPQDKQMELQKMTEQAQGATANQNGVIVKIREYMQANVPNISQMVNDYMIGFRNQYMAGRY